MLKSTQLMLAAVAILLAACSGDPATSTPASAPTTETTATPINALTAVPTVEPTAVPAATPTTPPTAAPTATPTTVPAPTPTAAPTPVPPDRDALIALYNAAGGDNWVDNTNWLSDRPLGEWYGVWTNSNGRVAGLELHLGPEPQGEIPTKLPAGAFHDLTELGDLRIIGMPIEELQPDVFEGLSQLRQLEISYTGLKRLPSGVFDSLENLANLSIYSNPLSELPSDVFASLPSLHHLTLERNQLTRLPTGLFDGLSRLESLWLRGNGLTAIPDGAFDDLSRLEVLWLDQNRIAELDKDAFKGLASLTDLDLDNNQISDLPEGIFDGLADLDTLSMLGNPGAPFVLDVGLQRADAADSTDPGPAEVSAYVREGAPFPIGVPLLIAGGSSGADLLNIAAGDTHSDTTLVTPAGDNRPAYVWLESVPQLPGGFWGFELHVGVPLVLFANADNDWPQTMEDTTHHILQVGGLSPTIDLNQRFSDPDLDELSFKASSSKDAVAVMVFGSTLTLAPVFHGDASVTVTATDPGGLSASLEFPVTVIPATDGDSFDISLVFVNQFTARQTTQIHNAAARWERIIEGDLPDVPADAFEHCGFSTQVTLHGEIDDILVFVENGPVPGGKAYAGVCQKRDGSLLPFNSYAVFDIGTAAIDDIALHELGHTLGIGTIWEENGLLKWVDDEPYFTGPLTIEAYREAGGTAPSSKGVPVSPWDLGHWYFGGDETGDVMEGNASLIISAITIQSLADLGYEVDLSQADPYLVDE